MGQCLSSNLTDLDGLNRLQTENAQLRAQLAAVQAGGGGGAHAGPPTAGNATVQAVLFFPDPGEHAAAASMSGGTVALSVP